MRDMWEESDDWTGWNKSHARRRVRPLRDWVDTTRENRTREQSPYAYTEFYHWRDEKKRAKSSAVYSDRMFGWDPKRMQEADKMFGRRFEQMSREQIDQYASYYFKRPVHVTALAEGCNPSNGYPYYILWFLNKAEGPDEVEEQGRSSEAASTP